MLSTEKCKSNKDDESYLIHQQKLKKFYNTCWQEGREIKTLYTVGENTNKLVKPFRKEKKYLPTVKTEHILLDSLLPMQSDANMPTRVKDVRKEILF